MNLAVLLVFHEVETITAIFATFLFCPFLDRNSSSDMSVSTHQVQEYNISTCDDPMWIMMQPLTVIVPFWAAPKSPTTKSATWRFSAFRTKAFSIFMSLCIKFAPSAATMNRKSCSRSDVGGTGYVDMWQTLTYAFLKYLSISPVPFRIFSSLADGRYQNPHHDCSTVTDSGNREMQLTWSINRATVLILSRLRCDSGPDRVRNPDRGLRASRYGNKPKERRLITAEPQVL